METRDRKLVYIAHRVSGDIEANIGATLRAIKWVNLGFPDVVPLCPWLPDVLALDDTDPVHRAKGIANDQFVLPLCDEVWVFGPWLQSKGVRAEIILAVDRRKVVRFFPDVPWVYVQALKWGDSHN